MLGKLATGTTIDSGETDSMVMLWLLPEGNAAGGTAGTGTMSATVEKVA